MDIEDVRDDLSEVLFTEKQITDRIAAMARQIERDYPGLTVRMDGDAAARPLSEFLAAIKAEADEMEADAPLMQVAAECALLNGIR